MHLIELTNAKRVCVLCTVAKHRREQHLRWSELQGVLTFRFSLYFYSLLTSWFQPILLSYAIVAAIAIHHTVRKLARHKQHGKLTRKYFHLYWMNMQRCDYVALLLVETKKNIHRIMVMLSNRMPLKWMNFYDSSARQHTCPGILIGEKQKLFRTKTTLHPSFPDKPDGNNCIESSAFSLCDEHCGRFPSQPNNYNNFHINLIISIQADFDNLEINTASGTHRVVRSRMHETRIQNRSRSCNYIPNPHSQLNVRNNKATFHFPWQKEHIACYFHGISSSSVVTIRQSYYT